MKDIVIIGSGGFAKEVAFLLEDINKQKQKWKILGYVDNNKSLHNGKYKVYMDDYDLLKINKEINVVFGIGDTSLLKKLSNLYKKNNFVKFNLYF